MRCAVRAREYRMSRGGTTHEGLAMARQRRGEPGGDARRRGGSRARLGLLAGVAAAGVTAACPQGGRRLGGPGFAGRGSGGGGTGATSVVGTWRHFTTFFDAASGDALLYETHRPLAAAGPG